MIYDKPYSQYTDKEKKETNEYFDVLLWVSISPSPTIEKLHDIKYQGKVKFHEDSPICEMVRKLISLGFCTWSDYIALTTEKGDTELNRYRNGVELFLEEMNIILYKGGVILSSNTRPDLKTDLEYSKVLLPKVDAVFFNGGSISFSRGHGTVVTDKEYTLKLLDKYYISEEDVLKHIQEKLIWGKHE